MKSRNPATVLWPHISIPIVLSTKCAIDGKTFRGIRVVESRSEFRNGVANIRDENVNWSDEDLQVSEDGRRSEGPVTSDRMASVRIPSSPNNISKDGWRMTQITVPGPILFAVYNWYHWKADVGCPACRCFLALRLFRGVGATWERKLQQVESGRNLQLYHFFIFLPSPL